MTYNAFLTSDQVMLCLVGFGYVKVRFMFGLLRSAKKLLVIKFLVIVLSFRLTLVLSCAMKFESYPHDTQICSMSIESCKYYLF